MQGAFPPAIVGQDLQLPQRHRHPGPIRYGGELLEMNRPRILASVGLTLVVAAAVLWMMNRGGSGITQQPQMGTPTVQQRPVVPSDELATRSPSTSRSPSIGSAPSAHPNQIFPAGA